MPVEFEQSKSLVEVFQRFKYWGEKIEPVLEQFFKQERKNPYCVESGSEQVIDAIADLTLRGGKRQRVAFVGETFKLLGGELTEHSEKAILATAAGVEILQTQLLIHDDIIDRAPLRRGGPTIHAQFYQRALQEAFKIDQTQYGDSVAILAGDLTTYLACYPILRSSEISSSQKIRILDILMLSGIDTFYGQLLDLFRDAKGFTTEEEILYLAFIKAGRSSAEAPMFIGAVLAGNEKEETFEKIKAYAVPASMAGQLQDDILGIFGDQDKLGKSALSDVAQGKQTLLVLKARECSDAKQLRILESYVGKKDVTITEAELVKRVMVETGALDYVKNKAVLFSEKAREALQTWDESWGQKEKDFFEAVTVAAIQREY